MDDRGVHRQRDDMLQSARELVAAARERSDDPERIADAIVAAWSSGAWSRISVATDFHLHERSGVEGLAFAVSDDRDRAAGGIVLRFGSEYPDSFERVDVADGAHDAVSVWEAFFGPR